MEPCRRSSVLVLCAALAAAGARAQVGLGNYGIVISEAVHGPSQPLFNGQPIPTYVEFVNLQIANPFLPVPMRFSDGAGSATLTINVGGSIASLTIGQNVGGTGSPTTSLGGNVQPPPAAQPAVPPAEPPVLLIASAPFPPGFLPAGAKVLVDATLFSGPRAAFAAAGVATEICLSIPALTSPPQPPLADRLAVPPAVPVVACAPAAIGGAFLSTGTLVNTAGAVTRWMYVDSDTDLDFDGVFSPSPGAVNPEMSHVDGFLFAPPGPPGQVHPNPESGAPLTLAGTLAGTLSSANATVSGIKFHNQNPPYDRVIANPVFDRILGASATITGSFTSVGPSFTSLPGYLSGLTLAGTNVSVAIPPAAVGGTPGALSMSNGPSTLVAAGAEPAPQSATQFRLRRIYTDFLADSGTTATGDADDAATDTLPGSTGGGNVWCEVIVYDAAGNRYKGKAKNWPSSGCTGGAKLALGTTPGTGEATLIDYCFNPSSTVYNLFSMTPAISCGGPLLFGLCPDALTTWLLSPPLPLGSEPFHVVTDVDGVYGWSVPAPAMIAFVGMTFEGVGVEYNGGGVVQISSTAEVTF
jgi:hypothetical protein